MEVWLRPLEKIDLQKLCVWANDPEVTHYMFMGAMPVYIEDLEREFDPQKAVRFAIVSGRTYVGVIGLHDINWVSRSAELRILIGDKLSWGTGVGTEATKQTIKYGFDILNLNRIWIGTNAGNKGAIKMFHKAGMTDEGILRQEIYRNGFYYDAIRMGILREEYAKKT